MSGQLIEVGEEGGQSMDVESAVGVAEGEHGSISPPEASEEQDGQTSDSAVGQLSGERGDGHLEGDSVAVQEVNGERSRGGEGRDGDREGSCVSSDDEGASQNGAEGTPASALSSSKPTRLVQLPLARVKNIMKSDPDVGITSQDSIFLVAKATEQFVEYLAKELGQRTHEEKRKVVQRKDLDVCVKRIDGLLFLEGAID